MAQENVNENQEETLEAMPGADVLPEEEQGQDFKVDMNFEETEEQEETEVEEESEPEAEEETAEGEEEDEEEEETKSFTKESRRTF